MKKILLFVCVLGTLSGYAQNEDAIKFAETITTDDLYEHLSILASDALEGRETGERGQKMAAAFLADHYERLGLEAVVPTKGGMSYYQKFNLESSKPGEIYATSGDSKFINGKDLIYWGRANMADEGSLDIVFAGKGSAEDYAKVDLKGKAAMISWSEGSFQQWRSLINGAEEAGAALVVLVASETDEAYAQVLEMGNRYFMRGSLGLKTAAATTGGTFLVSPSVSAKMMGTTVEKMNKAAVSGSLKKVKPAKIRYKTTRDVKLVGTENVLGYLEGTDKKDEVVVISAHYDHIGRNGDQINNGADDDGSGTSSVLEIAQAFVEAKKAGKGPRRSILFLTVTGEEKGLLGSEYYTNNPIFPLEQTVVDLNIDMVGRVDPEHANDSNYVYLVGSDRLSTELHEISEKVNETFTGFNLDYTYNDENHKDRIYYRSDHWNFAKNNVPIIFYFNGTHDDYHQPSDTIDKIEFELLAKRAQLVFHTAWVLSNREERVVVDQLQNTTLQNRN